MVPGILARPEKSFLAGDDTVGDKATKMIQSRLVLGIGFYLSLSSFLVSGPESVATTGIETVNSGQTTIMTAEFVGVMTMMS